MGKLAKLFKSWRIWLVIIFLALSVLAINPQFETEGVAIRNVERDSPAAQAGILSPEGSVSPTQREKILEVNGIAVNDVSTYYALVDEQPVNTSLTITTENQRYSILKPPKMVFDTALNTTVENGSLPIGITVMPSPKNNLRLGLDLSGGTRVILEPEEKVSGPDLELIIANIKERLNVYGLSDVVVRSARDLSGTDFIIVEIAGANREEVRELLSNQGKFEARIGNSTVFKGGNDITYVCRTAECSGIDRQQGCGQSQGGWACRFSFEIQLSPEAAQRQADITEGIEVYYNESPEGYLADPLDLYLDDELVDSLQVSASLKGRAVTSILISGSGFGITQRDAAEDAVTNMKQLQTVLVTGSLPVKLEIVKSDGISPALGEEFVDNAVLLALLSILAVAIVVAVRYRKPIVAIPVITTMLSEVTIILGFAAAVGWNLDLAAIAAIVIAIGSGVDDQIVLIDETLHGEKRRSSSWKERLAAAFFIIFASYFTLAAAMLPLFFAGAGLLRGFAITTLVGVTAGVLITRPAFAKFIEILLKKESN